MTGLELKKLRKKFQMKQKDMAGKLRVTRNYISMVESGKKKISKKMEEDIRTTFNLYGAVLPMEAKLDFLRVRFKINDPFKVIEKVLGMDSNIFGHKEFGFYHYTATYFFSEIFVYYHPSDVDMGVLLEFKGKGCREFESILEAQNRTWTEFFWSLYEEELFGKNIQVDTKITRIDVALDELVSDRGNYSLHELKDKFEQGLVETTFKDYDFRGGYIKENGGIYNKGLSLYFGSRQSPLYFNFYQKDYELAKDERMSVEYSREKYGIKNRYEVRLSDKKAYLFVEYLLSTGESLDWVVRELIDTSIKVYDCDENGLRTGFSRNWRDVIESMQELRLTVSPEKPSLERTLRWISNFLAPALKKVKIVDEALGTNELMERIEKAELKVKDEEQVYQIVAEMKDLLLDEEQTEAQVNGLENRLTELLFS